MWHSTVSPVDQIWKFWVCSTNKHIYFRNSHLTAVLFPDPPKVTALHLVESSPTSLSLQWSVSHRAKPVATHYELMYRKKVSNNILFSSNTSLQILICDSGIVILHFIIFLSLSRLQENDEEKASGKVTTYTVLVLDKNSAKISNLSPSTVYLFKVQALSSEGNPGSYSKEQEFSTLPQGEKSHKVCFYIYNCAFE